MKHKIKYFFMVTALLSLILLASNIGTISEEHFEYNVQWMGIILSGILIILSIFGYFNEEMEENKQWQKNQY